MYDFDNMCDIHNINNLTNIKVIGSQKSPSMPDISRRFTKKIDKREIEQAIKGNKLKTN